MKFKEVTEKTENELALLEEKLVKELAGLRLMAKVGQLAQNSKINVIRRDLARIHTSRRQKSLIQGEKRV